MEHKAMMHPPTTTDPSHSSHAEQRWTVESPDPAVQPTSDASGAHRAFVGHFGHTKLLFGPLFTALVDKSELGSRSGPRGVKARKKNIPGWPAIGSRFAKRKTDGSRRFAQGDSLQPPDSFQSHPALQNSLPPRRIGTQPWALKAPSAHRDTDGVKASSSTTSLLRSQDPAPIWMRLRATLLEMPSAQPGDLDRPPAVSTGGIEGICSVLLLCPVITTSVGRADARPCPLQGGLPHSALDDGSILQQTEPNEERGMQCDIKPSCTAPELPLRFATP
ncbi:hypothetical protein QBC39DRAFT_334612 [Podospora conica]|nr:hypothetical protein QBC39DRAFT_334612 [Schizothecium conicum]